MHDSVITSKKDDGDENQRANMFAKFPTNNSTIDNKKKHKNYPSNNNSSSSNNNKNCRDSTAVIVMFFEDITHEAYLQRLEELNLYKMKMLSSISHELKTPLNCSMGMLEELNAFV